MRALYGLLPLVVAVSACTGNTPPHFDAAADKDNQLSFSHHESTTIIEVRSPGGIGQADVSLASGDFPQEIVLRLYLSGLEGFRLTYGGTTVSASASGTSAAVSQSLLEPGGGQVTLTPASPLWMDIRPGDEFIEITLPGALTREKPESFSFQWVDFYR